MRVSYDPEGDAIYFDLSPDAERKAAAHGGDDTVQLDFDERHRLVRVTVLNAGEHVPQAVIDGASILKTD